MTIGILRRLLQILTLVAALALVLALARLGSQTAPALSPPALGESAAAMGAHAGRAASTRGLPDLLQLRPSPRAWRSAGVALAATAVLVVPATVVALLAGTLAGLWAATAGAAVVRSAIAVASAVAFAVPVFLMARVAIAIVGATPDSSLALLEGHGTVASLLALLASPVAMACIVVMALASIPGVLDAVRIEVRAAASAPWMRFARAQGVPRQRIVAALLRPIVIVTGARIAPRVVVLLLAVACVVENVAGWPGIGHLLVASLAAGDLAVSSASALVLAATIALLGPLGSTLSRGLDPRPQGKG